MRLRGGRGSGAWFGADIAFRGDNYRVDLAGLSLLRFALRATLGREPLGADPRRDRGPRSHRPRRIPPQAARALGITAEAAQSHIERIYTKTGAATRSTATLFAMQHGLLDSLAPLDS